MKRPPVVVVGLDCPTGLQAARVFDARGVEVIGVAFDPRHPCARTRACRRVVRSERGPEGVVEALLRLAPTFRDRPVLLPCTDLAVLGISRHRDELAAHYRMAVPEPEVIELLLDKARFTRFAEAHGLPIPATYVVRSREEAEAAAEAVTYPCVLKPAVKTTTWSTNATAKALVAESRSELLDLHARHAEWADALLVQEWIEGADEDHYTCDCYLGADGEPLATYTTRKLRQWPPTVGQGCLSVEHRCDTTRDLAVRVLRAAGHRGQGYLEVKHDTGSGRYLIIEANVGRPTGRSTAADRSGVELLMTLYCDLVGEPLPTTRTQRFEGHKWIHVRRDVQACVRLLLRREITPRQILNSWRGPKSCALFSLRDPLPFLADLIGSVGNVPRLWSDERRTLAAWTAAGSRSGRGPGGARGPRGGPRGGGEIDAPAPPGRDRRRFPRAPSSRPVDYEVPGIVRVRVLGAGRADLRAVERNIGRRAADPGDPDILVSFVDELSPSSLRLMDGGRTAYGDGGSYFLAAPGGAPVAHVRPGERWGQAVIVCRRGTGRVPCLSSALDLVALARGWLPLHASAWVWQGRGVIAAGWARSGKTGALLAAVERGATLVGDDRILLSSDGRSMRGLGRPPVARDWHLSQVRLPRARPGRLHRAFSATAPGLGRLAERLEASATDGWVPWLRAARKGADRVRGLLDVEIHEERLAPDGAVPCARPDVLILLETHERPDVTAERIGADVAARRLALQVESELIDAIRAHLSLQYADPSDAWRGVRDTPMVAAHLLRAAVRDKTAFVVRHPYPCPLERLHEVIADLPPGPPLEPPEITRDDAKDEEPFLMGPAA